MIVKILQNRGSAITAEDVARVIERIANAQGLEVAFSSVSGKELNFSLRLRKPVYHTYMYTATGNWKVYVNGEGKLVARNLYFNYEVPIKRYRFLQWCHWARFDNRLNEALDELNVNAVVKSVWGHIRRGYKWKWIDPYPLEHECLHDIAHKP